MRPSMSSAAVSPAKTSASLARALGSTGRARVFGQSTPASFASYDPATSSWRTFQLSLLEDSGESLRTWPRSGMTRNGTAYQLQPSAPLTAATASGLLPTPTAQDAANDGGPSQMERNSLPLNAAVKLPTPRATDADRGGRGDLIQAVRGNRNPHFWRTLSASDALGGPMNPQDRLDQGHTLNLKEQVWTGGEGGGSLNPTWVEWLLGFPLGWTDLEVSGTRSSRRSPNGLGDESSLSSRSDQHD